MKLKALKRKHFLDPLGNSPLTAAITGWILEHEEAGNKGPLHVIVEDKRDLAVMVAAILQVNLFFHDFFDTVEKLGFHSGDLIRIGNNRSGIIARYLHYSRKDKRLYLQLRKGEDLMQETWPLVNPLCIRKVNGKSLRISNQKDAWKRFQHGMEYGYVSAVDRILGIESFGNKNLFTSKVVLVTHSIKKARNYLCNRAICDEPLNKVVNADQNLIFKNSLDELVWTEGEELKKEILTTLINPVLNGEERSLMHTRLFRATDIEKVAKILEDLESVIILLQDEDRSSNFQLLLRNIQCKLRQLLPAFLTDDIKLILVEDPSIVLTNIKAYNKVAASGKRIIIFSDPKSMVVAFQETICTDKQNNLLEDYQSFLQGISSIFYFKEEADDLISAAAEDTFKYQDTELWNQNLTVRNFRLTLDSITPGKALQEVIKYRNDFFMATRNSRDEKLKRLFYTCILPLMDLISSVPVLLGDTIRTLIANQLNFYKEELEKGDYQRYIGPDLRVLIAPDNVASIINRALSDIDETGKTYFQEKLPEGSRLEYTGKFQKEVLQEIPMMNKESRTLKKVYISATRSNFRQLVDECLNRTANDIVFLGTADECRYIEHRLFQAFHIPECIMTSSFFPENFSLVEFLERQIIEPVAIVEKNRTMEDIFGYLSTIQITPFGTISKSSMNNPQSERKIRAGLLYLNETREMFYPLEGSRFFCVHVHTSLVEENNLSELEEGDVFLYMPELSGIMKKNIQEALGLFNTEAYRTIYEWKELLTRLKDIFQDTETLAAALLSQHTSSTLDNLRNMRTNIQRWLNEHSDLWTPDRDNLLLIYQLSSTHKLIRERNLETQLELVRTYVNYARETREIFRRELKRFLQAAVKSHPALTKNFSFLFMGKQLEVYPLTVINNRTEGINIDSSVTYKLKNAAEW